MPRSSFTIYSPTLPAFPQNIAAARRIQCPPRLGSDQRLLAARARLFGGLPLEAIEQLIVQARHLGLANSVYLLSMVHLDLKTEIHEIDDEELEAFSKVIRSALDLP